MLDKHIVGDKFITDETKTIFEYRNNIYYSVACQPIEV